MSRTASTLISGVVCGMTITARMPRWRAEKATPWAWLPALAAMTPRARSARRQVRDAVVRAAELEAEDRLQIFALEEHGVAQALGQARRSVERRLLRDVVDPARQDEPQHRLGIDLQRPACRHRVVRSHEWHPSASGEGIHVVEDASGGDFRPGSGPADHQRLGPISPGRERYQVASPLEGADRPA